jgi:DNA-binding transcriptional LysR family regulator
MDQQQLVAFERIVREGSFNRAARLLGVSQATISVRIQALEKELAGPLFVRGGLRAALTESGEAFLPYARRALDVIAAGREAAWHAPAGREGRVVVGAVDSIVDGFLVPVVARYVREHPRVALSIRTGHTPQIVQELADGIVRLGLVTWQYATGAVGLEALARFHEPLVAVVAPAHPLATRGPLAVAQVLAGGDPYHETVWGTADDGRLARATGRGGGSQEFPHGLMRQLILRGIGAGFLPRPLVQDDLAGGRLVALPLADGDDLSRELALVRHASADPLPHAARDLVAIVQAEVARLR